MIWEDLIIIFMVVNLVMVMRYLDTQPGYTCPQYCSIDHEHYPQASKVDQSNSGDIGSDTESE